MKIKHKEEFTITIDREELNAILLGLCQVQSLERYGENIEFHGYGVRRTTKTTALKLINQIKKL